jgi:MurNAc alpha-1-phosphate uridylyltransferase
MSDINEAMIFAAGFGKRMYPLSTKVPKPLLKVNGKPIIFYIIENLINLNFKNIVINTHHLSDKFHDELKPFSNIVKIVFEEEILDTGGGFLNAIKRNYFYNIKSPKVLINGDVLWKKTSNSPLKNILRNWNEEKMDLLLCLIKKRYFFGYKGKGDFNLEEPQKEISRLKLEWQKDFVFSGLQIVKPRLLQEKNEKKFSMREIFFSNIEKNIYGINDKNEWYHISEPDDLKNVNDRLKI